MKIDKIEKRKKINKLKKNWFEKIDWKIENENWLKSKSKIDWIRKIDWI